MDPAELLHLLPGCAEFAQNVAFQIELVDGPHGVRAVEILLWPRCDTDRPGSADARPNRAKHQVVVKDLNPAVSPIADINVALGVSRDGVRRAELSGLLALHTAAKGLDESAVLVVFHDPRVAIAIGDEDVSRGVPSDIGLPAEG